MQKIIIPRFIATVPIITGLAVGLIIGFGISFSACFKQQCSFTESSAIFTIPLLSFVLTVPLAVIIYKKRSSVVKSIDRLKSSIWVILGVLIILFTVTYVYFAVDNNIRNGEVQKIHLTNVE